MVLDLDVAVELVHPEGNLGAVALELKRGGSWAGCLVAARRVTVAPSALELSHLSPASVVGEIDAPWISTSGHAAVPLRQSGPAASADSPPLTS